MGFCTDQLVMRVVCLCVCVVQGHKGDKGEKGEMTRSAGVIIPDSNGLPTGYIEGPPGPPGTTGPAGPKVASTITLSCNF